MQSRLQEFLDRNGLMPSTQSAYRQLHSTETAVTIYNDLLSAADSGQLTALSAGLDSPFDTVDHELLLLQSNVSLVCAALFFNSFSLICLAGLSLFCTVVP